MAAPRRSFFLALIALLLILLALLWSRCTPKKDASSPAAPANAEHVTAPAEAKQGAIAAGESASPAAPQAEGTRVPEKLGEATVKAPATVLAGASFQVSWTGPANPGDYLTIVPPDAAPAHYENYADVDTGNPVRLTASVEPGAYEVRYVTVESKTVLAKAPITVQAAAATLEAAGEAVLGSTLSVKWTGPANQGDYITLVPADLPDGRYGNYTDVGTKSPINLLVPAEAGAAELRYMTSQGHKVLARRPVSITRPKVTLNAPAEVVQGSNVSVTWEGPANPGDYITVVAADQPDGRYGNYTDTSRGSPMTIVAPIETGPAELRYMTGQGGKVLARRSIAVVPAKITLDGPAQAEAGSTVSINWTGPNNAGDYLTIVVKSAAEGQFAAYQNTSDGSPARIAVPKEAGEAEVRYISGQQRKVLARAPLKVKAP